MYCKHKLPYNYIQGDSILINNSDVTPGVNTKLIPKFNEHFYQKSLIQWKICSESLLSTDILGFLQTEIW